MPTYVRAKDGSIQSFPDTLSQPEVRFAMLAYDNKNEWGPVAGEVATAAGQTTLEEAPDPDGLRQTAAVSPHPSVRHPGFVESLIPVWGSGREAVADLQEGDYWGALLNGALAGSDVFLAGSVAKGIAKGGLFAAKGAIGDKAAAATWRRVRGEMAKRNLIEKGQHGHHWLIPQNEWGKFVPNAVKNHPLNIMPLPTEAVPRSSGKGVNYLSEVHGRLHNQYMGLRRFNPAERYWHGTPAWWKYLNGEIVGHPASVLEKNAKKK